MDTANPVRSVPCTWLRVLTLRASGDELRALGRRHLGWGLAMTWLVGMGRFWDRPDVPIPLVLGLGSIGYVFALSALLWLVNRPLRREPWSPRSVLAFVTLTSAPGLVYALPLHWWMDLGDAQRWNVWLLALVATWRVALLFAYLHRTGPRGLVRTVVGTFFPIGLILLALSALNLERATFDLMSGVDPVGGTDVDAAYAVMLVITYYSLWVTAALGLAWMLLVLSDVRRARQERSGVVDGKR